MKKSFQIKKIYIHLKNADITTAEGITNDLYQMVDDREVEWVSIDNVKKSPHSLEIVIGVTIFVMIYAANYMSGKAIDIPYNHAKKKILAILQNRKNRSQTKLDIFMDDKSIN